MSKPVNTFDNGSASHVFEPVAKNLIMFILLVVLTILKNMKVNGKDYPIYIVENKKWLKPPTSHIYSSFFREWVKFPKITPSTTAIIDPEDPEDPEDSEDGADLGTWWRTTRGVLTLGATKASEVTSKTPTTAKRAMARTAKRATAIRTGAQPKAETAATAEILGGLDMFGWNVWRWFLECFMHMRTETGRIYDGMNATYACHAWYRGPTTVPLSSETCKMAKANMFRQNGFEWTGRTDSGSHLIGQKNSQVTLIRLNRSHMFGGTEIENNDH